MPNLVVSGGNRSALHLMRQEMWCGEWTSFVSHLRIGESAFLGWDIIDHTPLWGCYRDVCLLTAEVIEVQTKSTAKGLRRRAVLAVGRQDIGAGHLQPRRTRCRGCRRNQRSYGGRCGRSALGHRRRPALFYSRLRCSAGTFYLALC